MKLRKYEQKLKDEGLLVSTDLPMEDSEINLVTFDSREACQGTLFLCKGAAFKEDYLRSAFERGAIAYVAGREHPGFPGMVVSDLRKTQAILADLFYDKAWRAFPLVGITGTKGKSTTAYFLCAIMDAYYRKRGMAPMGFITTIDTFDGVERFESHLTTPEALELGKRFANAKKAGLPSMVMEVSSQALKYDRTLGLKFTIGCFTNFGEDHIGASEHSDVEDYFRSKLRIFSQCRTAVISRDSDRFNEILTAAEASPCVEKIITYSAIGEEADLMAKNVRKDGALTRFELEATGSRRLCGIALSMPGLFNVENALAACAMALELGVSAEELPSGLADARAAGRMELFENKERQIVVISDFAHNGLSFEKVFSSIREEYPGWRVVAVFGAPGSKAFSRRVDLPRVAAQYADYIYLTEDDPADEDPVAIAQILAKTLQENNCPFEIIPDRKTAVLTAITKAPPKTVVALLAKGREGYIKRGAVYEPYESDSVLAEKYLHEI